MKRINISIRGDQYEKMENKNTSKVIRDLLDGYLDQDGDKDKVNEELKKQRNKRWRQHLKNLYKDYTPTPLTKENPAIKNWSEKLDTDPDKIISAYVEYREGKKIEDINLYEIEE